MQNRSGMAKFDKSDSVHKPTSDSIGIAVIKDSTIFGFKTYSSKLNFKYFLRV